MLTKKRSRLTNKNSRVLLKCYSNRERIYGYDYEKNVPRLDYDESDLVLSSLRKLMEEEDEDD